MTDEKKCSSLWIALYLIFHLFLAKWVRVLATDALAQCQGKSLSANNPRLVIVKGKLKQLADSNTLLATTASEVPHSKSLNEMVQVFLVLALGGMVSECGGMRD